MKSQLRRAALSILKRGGVFSLIQDSAWRRQRLLILCYHGICLEDENQWRPFLYMTPELFGRRLEMLQDKQYTVLPLSEALERLYRKDLPPRSVALTFDDGNYDFYQQAWPLLRQHGFPVTVYVSTYYSELQRPVFHLMLSYLLWKARGVGQVDLKEFGIDVPCDLRPAEHREQVATRMALNVTGQNLSGEEKDQYAAKLAAQLNIDYTRLRQKRILQLMNRDEIRELATEGVDFQLHTHRHRTPSDERLFRREIQDNRASLAGAISGKRQHFCYPSGAYQPDFLSWLAKEEVVSSTTCDTGLATPETNALLLPRLVDTDARTDLDFESWLCGVGHFLSMRKRARLAYMPT